MHLIRLVDWKILCLVLNPRFVPRPQTDLIRCYVSNKSITSGAIHSLTGTSSSGGGSGGTDPKCFSSLNRCVSFMMKAALRSSSPLCNYSLFCAGQWRTWSLIPGCSIVKKLKVKN